MLQIALSVDRNVSKISAVLRISSCSSPCSDRGKFHVNDGGGLKCKFQTARATPSHLLPPSYRHLHMSSIPPLAEGRCRLADMVTGRPP